MKATFLESIAFESHRVAALCRVNPPYKGHELVVITIIKHDNQLQGMIFPGNADGTIAKYDSLLSVKTRTGLSTSSMLRAAGYNMHDLRVEQTNVNDAQLIEEHARAAFERDLQEIVKIPSAPPRREDGNYEQPMIQVEWTAWLRAYTRGYEDATKTHQE